MADLPQNTTYKTAGATPAPKIKIPSPAEVLRGGPAPVPTSTEPAQPQIQNPLGAYEPVSQEIQEYTKSIQSPSAALLAQTPLGVPNEQKISAPPAGYSDYRFPGPGEGSNNLSGVKPITPAIHQMPFGGQMNVDTSSPGALIKSQRSYLGGWENSVVLGPLSGKMFQVDHIIPLFLGGADTLANKQNLPTPVHAAKTKIQSVAQTLYQNGEIGLDEARVMAMNWGLRKADGIPTPDETGNISLDTARAIAKRWKEQDSGTATPTFKEILAAVPEAADNFGKGTIPEFMRQLIIGTASGLTAGGVPLNSSKDATAVDKIAGLAGQVLGTFGGVGLFAGLTGAATKLLGRTALGRGAAGVAERLGITAARGSTIGELAGGPSVFAPMANLATPAAKASGALAKLSQAANPKTVLNNLKAMNVRDAIAQAGRNAVPFALYGQAGQTLSDFTQPQQDALHAHVERLTTDLTLGALTGVLPGTWKGTAGVSAGTFALGMMNGESPRQALSDAIAIGALHKVGGFAQDVVKRQKELGLKTDDAATKGAFTVLHTFAPAEAGVTRIRLREPAPAAESYTQEQVQEWTKQALKGLQDLGIKNSSNALTGAKGGLTPEMYMTARARIMAAAKWLETRKLPLEQQERAAVLDLTSMARTLKNKYDVENITTPNTVFPFAQELAKLDDIAKVRVPEKNLVNGRWELQKPLEVSEGLPENNGLRGSVRLTGQGATFTNESATKEFISKLDNNEASQFLLFVNQPEMAPFWKDLDRAKTPEMLKTKEHFIDEHPENFINVYGFVKGPDGQFQIQELGTRVPSKNRIGVPKEDGTVEGNKYAFNNDADIKSGKFPQENPNFNKDTIAMAMRNRGMPVVVARVGSYSEAGLKSGKPYIIADIGDAEWQMSKNIWNKIGNPAEFNTVEENLAQARADMGRRDIQPYVEKAAEQLAERGENALTMIEKTPLKGQVNEPRQKALFDFTAKAKAAVVEAKTPPEVSAKFKENLGVDLTPEEAVVLGNDARVTAGEVVETVKKAISEGRATPETTGEFKTFVEPFLNSHSFKNSDEGLVYAKMPLLSTGEAGGRHAERIASGSSMLERAPIIQPVAPTKATGALKEAISDLESIGLGTGRQYDSLPLDMYVDDLIKYIDNTGLSPEEKKRLGTEALKLINPEDLNLRSVSMGKSNENYQKGIRDLDIPVYLQKMKERIVNEFDSEMPALVGRTNEDRTAMAERIQKAVKEDVQPFLERVSQSRTAPPDTYERGYYHTFDELAKDFWGKDYKNNYGLMKILTDKTKFGKQEWTSERSTKTGPKGGLMDTETYQGRQIGQPAMVVEMAGRGQREGMSAAMAARNKELGREGGWPITPEGVVDMRPRETLPVKMGEAETDVYAQGGKQVNPHQLSDENVQDLTNYEAERRLGMLDEIRNGVDPELSPIRGAEDATSEIFGLVASYNRGVDIGEIKGKKIGSSKAKEIVANVKKSIAEERKQLQQATALAERAQKEIETLEVANESLANVGGTKAQAYSQKTIASNNERIEKLRSFLTEVEKITGKNKVPDGQGGPGYSETSPNQFGALSAPDPLNLPRPTVPLPGAVPGQSVFDYLKGESTYTKPKPVQELAKVDIQPAIQAITAGTEAINARKKKNMLEQAAANASEAVATVVDKVVGNKGTTWSRTPETNREPSAVIMGYDTTSYATDPAHPQKLNNILQAVGEISHPDQIEKYIRQRFPRSPVTGQMVYTASAANGVPPQLVLAIMQNDSSMGTAGLGAKTKNPGNVGNDDAGNIRKYQSWQQGVDAVAKWLAAHRTTS